VDPVSHCLLGRAINCLDSRRRLGPGAGAALVLGSLAPDIDGALVTRGWDVYLHYHQMGTHTLAASPLLAAAVTVLVKSVVAGSRASRLFLASWMGVVIGHVLFDLVSGSDLKLLMPLSPRVFGPRLLTMADLSAIAVLLAGTLVSFWRRRPGGWVIVTGLALLLVVKGVSQRRACDAYDQSATSQGARVLGVGRPEAISGSLGRWRFYDRIDQLGRGWIVDAWTERGDVVFHRTIPSDAAALATVAPVMALPVVQRFLGFAELPFPRVEHEAGERRVLWSDLRYCDAVACDLSFGAVVDERFIPQVEIIQIGGYRQTRPLGN
jgi:hypothetical protein